MITPMQMYWLTRCDSLVTSGEILAILTGILMIFGLVAYIVTSIDGYGNEFKIMQKILPCDIFIFTLSLMVSVFVPTTKEMAAIIVVPAIANNEKVQESAKNLIDLANEWMVELKPSKMMKSDEKQEQD